MASQIAFIGLGIMGGPMAGHLLAAGYPLVVHSRTQSRAADLLSRGAKWASNAADAAKDADVVFICVPDTPDVQAVADAILPGARSGQIVIDHSTISPAVTREIAEKFAGRGVQWLDAPISGGDIGAKNATLSIMAGGDEQSFNKVRPLLEKLGKTITCCGGSGTGQLTKLVNQILVSVTNLAVAEAMTFARASGLDPQKTIAAVGGGAAGSWQLTNLGPKMLAGDFRPGFMIKLQDKDLRLAMAACKERGMRLEALQLVHRLFEQGKLEGRGDEGTQALFALVEESAKER